MIAGGAATRTDAGFTRVASGAGGRRIDEGAGSYGKGRSA
jgi:hypothetical protein